MTYSNMIWMYENAPEKIIEEICEKANIPRLLAKVFIGRKIYDIEYIKKFLAPSLLNLHNPFLLKDMDNAVIRIIEAISINQKITIYGDYDVDGVTSTAVLFNFLSDLGADVNFYVPNRITEGYGVSLGASKKIHLSGTLLIIMVDCGTTAVEEVDYLNKNGVDVVITDHHECISSLPDACAVVNPCRPDSNYPFKYLAGVGVVYKLICAISERLGISQIKCNKYLDLVAMGTIADAVPLIDENRVIAKYGLQSITDSSNIGIKCLYESLLSKRKHISSWDIGFIIAPRINAAGRMETADDAVKLFITKNTEEACEIVAKLKKLNSNRQQMDSAIYSQAIKLIESDIRLEEERIIVIWSEGWSHSIVGIAASKISEKYSRPCILICINDQIGKGSGRSVEGFSLIEAMKDSEIFLERYGGHDQAVGLTIKVENLNKFRERINLYANEKLSQINLIKKVNLDALITSNEITLEAVRQLALLEPFGTQNPSPIFMCHGLEVCNMNQVGKNKHLKLILRDLDFRVSAIGFGMGHLINRIESSEFIDIVCAPETNIWKSSESVVLNLKEIIFNKDQIKEEMFFKSLDLCINTNEHEGEIQLAETEDIHKINTSKELSAKLYYEIQKGRKTVILINNLQDARHFINIFSRYIFCTTKHEVKVWYISPEIENHKIICIVINPSIDTNWLLNFDNIFFYGEWIDQEYFHKLVSNTKGGMRFLCNGITHKNKSFINVEECIVERNDLVAIYKHFISKKEKIIEISDMSLVARDISWRYNANMNYFKLNKGLDILKELNILDKRLENDKKIIITIFENKGNKVDIEESKIYRKLQSLKFKEDCSGT